MMNSFNAKVAAALTALAILAVPGASRAQQLACNTHDKITNHLELRYQERQVAYGLAGDAALVEVFASKAGTWTILITRTNGIACIIAAGENWEEVEPVWGTAS